MLCTCVWVPVPVECVGASIISASVSLCVGPFFLTAHRVSWTPLSQDDGQVPRSLGPCVTYGLYQLHAGAHR